MGNKHSDGLNEKFIMIYTKRETCVSSVNIIVQKSKIKGWASSVKK